MESYKAYPAHIVFIRRTFGCFSGVFWRYQ
ncbi:Uncharacterised protein [Leclercia adecarboxylata]|uniref:Uncharacterized protein n=1 Tax=Leclercia adecarboxylata TaxID=83655 RepID=A0A4U9HM51_9ENTR|nr:Uncharacterised protein [Leclercia adecarboxylata]